MGIGNSESGNFYPVSDRKEISVLKSGNSHPVRDRKELRIFRVRKVVSSQRQERDKSIQSQEICIQSETRKR